MCVCVFVFVGDVRTLGLAGNLCYYEVHLRKLQARLAGIPRTAAAWLVYLKDCIWVAFWVAFGLLDDFFDSAAALILSDVLRQF